MCVPYSGGQLTDALNLHVTQSGGDRIVVGDVAHVPVVLEQRGARAAPEQRTLHALTVGGHGLPQEIHVQARHTKLVSKCLRCLVRDGHIQGDTSPCHLAVYPRANGGAVILRGLGRSTTNCLHKRLIGQHLGQQ